MSRQLPLSLQLLMRDQHNQNQQHYLLPLQAPQAPAQASGLAPDWIPPPALLATVNSDAIDLNDEVFFNYNAVPSYTTESYAEDLAAPLLLLLTANFDFNYTAMPPHELAASPLKYAEGNTQYSHMRRFLLAVEQLNRMSLRAPSSLKLLSPDLYSVLAEPLVSPEERTVNPRHLLGGPSAVPGSASGGATAGHAFATDEPSTAASRSATRYILPSSVLSPALLSFFSKLAPIGNIQEHSGDDADPLAPLSSMAALETLPSKDTALGYTLPSQKHSPALNNPLNPYVMNDECVSAITYWLNNTADVILEKPVSNGARTPMGVMKPGWARRNLIQVMSPRSDDMPVKTLRTLSMEQKRRRRKSVNTSSSIPEGALPAGLSLSIAHARAQVLRNSSTLNLAHHAENDPIGLGVPLPSLTLPLSYKHEPTKLDNFGLGSFDAMDVAVPEPELTHSSKQGLFNYTRDTMENPTPMDLDGALPTSSHGISTGNMQGQSHAAELGDDEPKPFPCPDCDKQFKRLEHLKRHIRSVHSNIRPFHCKYCDKKFLRSDNLAQHQKTHFKMDASGTATIIYGNPNPLGRSGRKKSAGDADLEKYSHGDN